MTTYIHMALTEGKGVQWHHLHTCDVDGKWRGAGHHLQHIHTYH